MSDKKEKQVKKSSKEEKNVFQRFIGMIIKCFKSIVTYFKELKAEFKRITWPGKKQIKKSMIAVVVMCVMYIVAVGLLDAMFVNLFKLIV
ncbi:preprotein translocase, SecE subunit [Hathewaya proteolytica DSM 3090]|uniref:Protein translocase subunit SecE n=1 Tax=Hathewaya proteolytica DSM 3090 TaxID=1121331 RepID=A0A1M6T140_9CLOT|nr:preprotein translocase subunit SecE [Hathewaya proteolytica]SHK50644.1 preprotein translocase, SecE subunit [Hathewaya proteolytica DSM 3090]